MSASSDTSSPLPPRDGRRLSRRLALVLAAALASASLLPGTASAGPAATRLAYASGTLVPIPASVPHQEGTMIDSRLVPDLRWIAANFPVYVSEGYSGPLPSGEHVGCQGCHVRRSDHYNGLAVDIVPLAWSAKCDANWGGVSRLAQWAEPRQNQPAAPFRWVGYDGDAGHGCGNHLHLSWEHAPAPQFQLAEWVEVFPVEREVRIVQQPAPVPQPQRRRRPKRPKAPAGPIGGISRSESGGVSSRRS